MKSLSNIQMETASKFLFRLIQGLSQPVWGNKLKIKMKFQRIIKINLQLESFRIKFQYRRLGQIKNLNKKNKMISLKISSNMNLHNKRANHNNKMLKYKLKKLKPFYSLIQISKMNPLFYWEETMQQLVKVQFPNKNKHLIQDPIATDFKNNKIMILTRSQLRTTKTTLSAILYDLKLCLLFN